MGRFSLPFKPKSIEWPRTEVRSKIYTFEFETVRELI